MNKYVINEIDNAMRLHINYNGDCSGGYLKIMDRLACNYSGSLSMRVSALCNDYYKAVGVASLDEAFTRLHNMEKGN